MKKDEANEDTVEDIELIKNSVKSYHLNTTRDIVYATSKENFFDNLISAGSNYYLETEEKELIGFPMSDMVMIWRE